MSKQSPVGWNETSISELLKEGSLYSDGDWVESKDQDEEGTNRLIQLADIGDGFFQNKSNKFMNDEQFNKLRCTELKEGDILIARMPDPIGRACFFPKINQRCATVVDVAILRNPNADPYWLMSMINSSQFRRMIENHSTGTTRTRITRGFLAELRFFAPEIKIQTKIAVILYNIDQTIEKTEALIHKYQQIKAGLMHDLFTRGLTADGKLRPPREQAPELYQETPIGWIPKEWGFGLLNDIVNPLRPIVYGILMPGYGFDGGVPVVKVKDIQDRKIHIDNLLLTSPLIDNEYRRSKLKAGDILLTIRGTVGRVCIVPHELEGANITQDTSRIDLLGGNNEFYSFYFETDGATRHFSINTLGVAVQGINLGEVRKTPIPKPPQKEQVEIAKRISNINRHIDKEKNSKHKLTKQKSGLMHDLLTGKVPVKVDQEEPAHG